MKQTLASVAAAFAVLVVAPAAHAQAGSADNEAAYAPQLLIAGMRDRAALAACYRANREAFRSLSASVRFVRGSVTPDGRVRYVAIEPAARVPSPARRCVLSVISGWRVTPPHGGRALPLRIDVEGIRRAAGLARMGG